MSIVSILSLRRSSSLKINCEFSVQDDSEFFAMGLILDGLNVDKKV